MKKYKQATLKLASFSWARSVVVKWFKHRLEICRSWFDSRNDTNVPWQGINLHLPLYTQERNGDRAG